MGQTFHSCVSLHACPAFRADGNAPAPHGPPRAEVKRKIIAASRRTDHADPAFTRGSG